ncbi:MAG: response regulator [Deltaproteobacteria bacterium]|nr:response regulator [Deltaproteobacteria bacterium]
MDTAVGSVLVIDDEPDMRQMLAYDLTQEGYEVATAESGMAAIQAIRNRRFDVAVTDLKMPVMDGVQTLAALKEIDPDMEVIIATGYASLDSAVACLKHGAFDYIQKPYDLEQIRALLSRALEHSRTRGVTALYEASRELAAGLEHSDPLVLAVNIAGRVLRADVAALVLTPFQAGTWHDDDVEIVFPEGSPRPSAEALTSVALLAADERKPVRVPSPERPLPPPALADEYGTLLCYPLSARDTTLGVLVLLRKAGAPPFTPADVRHGTVFVTQIMIAIDNRKLSNELVRCQHSLN